MSGGLQCRVDFAVLFEPFDVAALGVLFHLAEEFYGRRFKAGFTGVGIGDECFDFNRNDIVVGSHQSSSLYSLACQTHSFTLQEVYRHQLGVVYGIHMSPNREYARAVGQCLLNLHNRMRLTIGPLAQKPPVLNAVHRLPFENPTLFQPFYCVLADEIPATDNQ
jgi:hypothetical protein